MRYLLILAIVLVSLCAGLPEIPFINPGNATVQKAGMVIIDEESPDVFITAEAIPTEVKAGRNVNIYFELRNKNNFDLKNVNLLVYDSCIFTGETEKNIDVLKANRSVRWSLKLTAGSTDLDKNCNVKFRVKYDAEYSMFQDIAVLTQSEYEQREVSGTLNSIPIQSSFPETPLKISLSFSDTQPFINNENYYMNLDYYNKGNGFIEVEKGNITIKTPSNIKDFSCSDYNDLALNRSLKFIENRAASSTCSFTTNSSQQLDIKSLSITARYKYMLDNSILIKVKRA
jgi:hypothetical protein